MCICAFSPFNAERSTIQVSILNVPDIYQPETSQEPARNQQGTSKEPARNKKHDQTSHTNLTTIRNQPQESDTRSGIRTTIGTSHKNQNHDRNQPHESEPRTRSEPATEKIRATRTRTTTGTIHKKSMLAEGGNSNLCLHSCFHREIPCFQLCHPRSSLLLLLQRQISSGAAAWTLCCCCCCCAVLRTWVWVCGHQLHSSRRPHRAGCLKGERCCCCVLLLLSCLDLS